VQAKKRVARAKVIGCGERAEKGAFFGFLWSYSQDLFTKISTYTTEEIFRWTQENPDPFPKGTTV
jgi:hypothetical protein